MKISKVPDECYDDGGNIISEKFHEWIEWRRDYLEAHRPPEIEDPTLKYDWGEE